MSLLALPTEVLERVLVHVGSLEDIVACARTGRIFRTVVYGPSSQHLWRALYLRNFDDPRTRLLLSSPAHANKVTRQPSASELGKPAQSRRTPPFDWRNTLQNIERARKALLAAASAVTNMSDDLRRATFTTLKEVALTAAPLDYQAPNGIGFSPNTRWLDALLLTSSTAVVAGSDLSPTPAATNSNASGSTNTSSVPAPSVPTLSAPVSASSAYLKHPLVTDESIPAVSRANESDFQALFEFQTIMGVPNTLSTSDRLAIRRAARLYVYEQANYAYTPSLERISEQMFGPFFDGGAVNWRAMFYGMALVWMCCPTPDSLPPNGVEGWRPAVNVPHDEPHDWAGVEGVWMFFTLIPDPNDIFRFNQPSTSPDGVRLPRDPSVFDSESFEDTMTLTDFVYRLVPRDSDGWARIGRIPEGALIGGIGGGSTLPSNPEDDDPNFPELRFTGRGRVALVIDGRVKKRRDGVIHWTIWTRTPDGRLGWLSEAIQAGGMKSEGGIIGQWMTNPLSNCLGPFWSFRTSRLTPEMRSNPEYLPPDGSEA